MTNPTLDALRRGDLAGARALRLPGLSAFPDAIFGLADTLEVLDLGGGTLTRLPDDLGRLHRLRVLFGSGNCFERLPASLGGCAALTQVGFRGVGLREVPAESLPPNLRWLTLTDNRIETLPRALGERPRLRKLMLAGNRLRDLPESLADAGELELLRLSANRFERLPAFLGAMPAVAWLAWAGNPAEDGAPLPEPEPVAWADLALGERLGEGASGHVHAALWRGRPVALKLFKGVMTSDGLPDREMAACLAAGAHPGLVGGLGRLIGHPEGTQGLAMPLLPAGWQALAGPPSLETCSRDVYAPGLTFAPEVVLALARTASGAAEHLHGRGISHGDLYAHNLLWDGETGAAALSDFGAASRLPAGRTGAALARIDVRAFGLLLDELIERCRGTPGWLDAARELATACTGAPAARPSMAEAHAAVRALAEG
ncbi:MULTISPECIES: leucine-rich repeat-containing protein kinase family protein [Methylobacterium]|uniref:Protein kinase domain-containing protein n=3 Tax=Pseudomonadota TaxID=1224 RepID=A0ABQ4T1Z5_9HYPH|nr:MULTISPECIES: leucine-rich repeat-containing protein kinase family protein [Methylobacterium]PIU06582.1 MAG: protein kinase [Methylobacterium sp. CG09_land_8_20_14_0_10_71_15]PIU12611.1 MAG: protein kinase [Methylobacterium sp. CG08_land_8_20_14_0_20_71_15]GBU19844.1 hypothetical protein AwMethylo_40590 [Methylobacterium sp.]GJE08034.1 hypothetical protein AOPFMNJM_3367 [Methylobacterium jeotgali]